MACKYVSALLMLLVASLSSVRAQAVLPLDWPAAKTMRGTYYSDRFVGRKTSSGEVFSQDKFTAAHRSYKFGTLLLVTNPKNGKQVILRVNDRCPKANIVDMTRRAAKQIGITSYQVEVQMLSDDFLPYWEAQEELIDVLTEGKFLDYARRNPAPRADTFEDTSKAGATSTSKTPKETEKTKLKEAEKQKLNVDKSSSKDIETQYYDIELCRISKKDAIKGQLSQMPIYYQDKVEYRTVKGAKGLIVILSISTSQDVAEKIRGEIKPYFPSAKVVKTK